MHKTFDVQFLESPSHVVEERQYIWQGYRVPKRLPALMPGTVTAYGVAVTLLVVLAFVHQLAHIPAVHERHHDLNVQPRFRLMSWLQITVAVGPVYIYIYIYLPRGEGRCPILEWQRGN